MSLTSHFTIVTYVYLIVFIIHHLWEYGLDVINIRWLERHRSSPPKNIPAMSEDTYRKSIDYSIENIRFSMIASIVDIILTWFFIITGFRQLDLWVRRVTSNEYIAGLIFFGVFTVISFLLHLPFNIYHDFNLEERYGFNRKTPRVFITDILKNLFLSLLIGVPLLLVLFYFMNTTGPHWWIPVFIVIILFQVLLAWIFPVLIAPLFNKFKPLEGDLRDEVTETARKAGIDIKGIYTMDGSRRSAHSNAYFTGLGRSKRIVFFDTLLEKVSRPQLLGILAHEMGHYRLGHVKKKILLTGILLLVLLKGMAFLREMPIFFKSFGFEEPSAYATLVVFSLLVGEFLFPLQFLFNAFSRRFEFDADRFAGKIIGSPVPLIEALEIIHKENLSAPVVHPLYAAYHYSHPALPERLTALNGLKASDASLQASPAIQKNHP